MAKNFTASSSNRLSFICTTECPPLSPISSPSHSYHFIIYRNSGKAFGIGILKVPWYILSLDPPANCYHYDLFISYLQLCFYTFLQRLLNVFYQDKASDRIISSQPGKLEYISCPGKLDIRKHLLKYICPFKQIIIATLLIFRTQIHYNKDCTGATNRARGYFTKRRYS